MIPVSLKLKNYGLHRDSFIDFSLFQSALIIGNTDGDYRVSNGSGKSSIFDGIGYALFGESKVRFANDVVLWGEEFCEVEFEFIHNNEKYKVVRGRKRISSTSYMSLFHEKNMKWEDISGSTPTLTDKKLVNLINFNYKTFANSTYFMQNDISEFANANAGRKKEILKSIVDLSKWDNYEKITKSKIKDLKTEIKILEGLAETLENIPAELNETIRLLEETSAKILDKKSLLSAKDGSYSIAQSRYSELKQTVDTDKWDSVVEEINTTKSKINNNKLKLSTSGMDLERVKKEIDSLKTDIQERKEILDSIQVISDVEDQIASKNEELIKHKSSVSSSEEILVHLVESEHDLVSGECPVCTQSVTEDFAAKLQDERISKRDSLTEKIIFSKNKIMEILGQLKKLESAKKNNQRDKTLRAEIKNLNVELNLHLGNFDRLSQDRVVLSSEIISLTENLSVLETTLNSLKNNDFQELQKSISSLKEERDLLSSEISVMDRSIGALTEKKETLTQRIKDYNSTKAELDQKRGKLAVLDTLLKYLGKNGIQIVLLEHVISDLENEANKILNHICLEQFEVMLETQREGSDKESIVETLDLVVKKDGMVQDFSCFGGGEKFRIALALRIALSEIACRHGGTQLDFILLDEVNSPLDSSGTDSLFSNVIKSLEEKYKILVITHNESLKERFENIIDVTKVNNESSVNFYSR